MVANAFQAKTYKMHLVKLPSTLIFGYNEKGVFTVKYDPQAPSENCPLALLFMTDLSHDSMHASLEQLTLNPDTTKSMDSQKIMRQPEFVL